MNRRGFTLLEVVVSLVILAFGMLALQSAVVRLMRQTGTETRTTTAIQLVQDRLDLVRSDPRYDLLESRYAATESDAGGMRGLTRVTEVRRQRDSTALGITDFKRVTVTVLGRGLAAPVARTVSVGAP